MRERYTDCEGKDECCTSIWKKVEIFKNCGFFRNFIHFLRIEVCKWWTYRRRFSSWNIRKQIMYWISAMIYSSSTLFPWGCKFRVCAQHHHATCYGIKVKESEGMMEGERQLLHKLMETKYQEDCTAWPQSLTEAQLHIVSSLILKCDTLEAVK